MISNDLAEEYQAQQEGQTEGMDQQATDGIAPLTPEVKQMIADEVKGQLALENAEAQQNVQDQESDPGSSSIARLLSDGRTHVFVAGSSLDLVDTAGTECAISDGDALELVTPPPASATSANLVVLSSKGGRECPKSDTVTVALSDLQDMQNHMRETIDQGLQELQSKQGTGGLPAAPPSARAAPVDGGFAKDAPPPDPNGAAVVNQQLTEADQAEKEVVGQAQQENGVASLPPLVQIVNGWVSDSKCGVRGANAGAAECTRKCIADGANMVVVTDGDQKILTVDNPDALKGHEGHHIAVTGHVDGDKIHVDSVEML